MKQMEQQMEEDKATDLEAVADCQKQMQKAHKLLLNCMGTYRAFNPLTGLYIEGAVFVGCLQAVTIQEFTKGDRPAGTLKNITRGLAVLSVPLKM
ncbi:hypothetical protein EZV62_023184 [Acer yangbiense]|uniref:Uncharacterized protein n=1 Tax=Acer yangbiense TaxID=1000413 RepID=A0A5C7H0Z9_9ROSI|nr:hypothetical protein EZV62_023184 [Acer yangbiense]